MLNCLKTYTAATLGLAMVASCGPEPAPREHSNVQPPAADTATAPRQESAAADEETVIERLAADDRFTTLYALVQLSGLEEDFAQARNVTILAPTDAAFDDLPDGTVELLRAPENRGDLQQILQLHVLDAMRMAGELSATMAPVSTWSGVTLPVTQPTPDSLQVGDALVVLPDILLDGAVIHGIDRVLLPSAQ